MCIMKDKSFENLWSETGFFTRPHKVLMSDQMSGPFDMFIRQYKNDLANI